MDAHAAATATAAATTTTKRRLEIEKRNTNKKNSRNFLIGDLGFISFCCVITF